MRTRRSAKPAAPAVERARRTTIRGSLRRRPQEWVRGTSRPSDRLIASLAENYPVSDAQPTCWNASALLVIGGLIVRRDAQASLGVRVGHHVIMRELVYISNAKLRQLLPDLPGRP